MLLPVFLFRDQRVLPSGDLTFSFLFHRRTTTLVRADRDDRQLSLEIRSMAGRTTGNITRAHQSFEFMTAAPTAEIIKRHVVPLRQSVTFPGDKLYA